MSLLRSSLVLSLLVALAACGSSDDADPSDADVRLAEANARVAEAEARAAEAEAELIQTTELDTEDTSAGPDEPDASPSSPPATATASNASSTRPGLTGLPPEADPEPLLEATQPFTFCETYEQSAVDRYKGMEVCYRGTLRQDGALLVGSGEKESENGEMLSGAARTPFRVEGRLYSDYTVRFNFTDKGSRRVSRGSASFPESGMNGGCEGYRWDGGTFQTDAANSSGSAMLFIEQQCDV